MSSDWKTLTLNEIVDFGNGKARPKTEGNTPIYGGNGILGYSGDSNYQDETIIIGRVGAYCGATYFENNPIWVSDNALSAKSKEGFIAKYSYYVLKSKNLNQYAQGSSHPLLTQGLLNKLEAYVTTNLEVQEKIVSIIGEIEDKINLNTQTNQTLEQIAQALFKSWFVDFEPVKAKMEILAAGGNAEDAELAAMRVISAKTLDELNSLKVSDPKAFNKLAETAALFPAAMQDSELGEIPEGWDVVRISDIVKRLKPNKRYTKKQIEPYGRTPVYEQGSSLLLGFHNDDAGFNATPKDPIFIFGDHTCITYLSCSNFDISSNVIPLKGGVRPTMWTYYAIQGKQEFQEYRRHWSEFIIKAVVLPSLELAEKYSELVTSKYLMIEALKRQSKKLEHFRDTLLPKLLSGEIDLTREVIA
ncbi:restriction endonuclease subunit S [Marinomonas agarivorans]|nr:restriction endonuclease subunit S [Marinomonas agarivorans]